MWVIYNVEKETFFHRPRSSIGSQNIHAFSDRMPLIFPSKEAAEKIGLEILEFQPGAVIEIRELVFK